MCNLPGDRIGKIGHRAGQRVALVRMSRMVVEQLMTERSYGLPLASTQGLRQPAPWKPVDG